MAWTGSDFEGSQEIIKAGLEDDGVDAVIVAFISFQLSMELPKAIINVSEHYTKPIAVCLGSLGAAASVVETLEDASIPTYPFPDRATTGLAILVSYGQILKTID